MPMSPRYKPAARIQTTHAKGGECIATMLHGLPPFFVQGMRVWLVPPELGFEREQRIEKVTPLSQKLSSTYASSSSQLRLKLSAVHTLNDAQKLVGKTLLVLEDELPQGYELTDDVALLGHSIVTDDGQELGTIIEILKNPAHNIWVVGPRRYLIPAVADFLVDPSQLKRGISPDEALVVRLPDGLLDLNTLT